MKKLILSILIITTLFFQGCGTDSDSSKTSVLLPLYSYPTHWEENTELTALIKATDGEFVAVINPDNGSGTYQKSAYVEGIDYLNNLNAKIVAYIYTDYGARDKEDIYAEIDNYIDFYGTEKVFGIFFDEVNLRSSEDEAYMKDISEYAKSKNLDFIVLNPGTTVDQAIVDEDYYDIILTRETSYSRYVDLTNTLVSSSRTKQSLTVYEYPNLPSYETEIQKAKDQGYDYIYLTTADNSNRWDTVFNFLK